MGGTQEGGKLAEYDHPTKGTSSNTPVNMFGVVIDGESGSAQFSAQHAQPQGSESQLDPIYGVPLQNQYHQQIQPVAVPARSEQARLMMDESMYVKSGSLCGLVLLPAPGFAYVFGGIFNGVLCFAFPGIGFLFVAAMMLGQRGAYDLYKNPFYSYVSIGLIMTLGYFVLSSLGSGWIVSLISLYFGFAFCCVRHDAPILMHEQNRVVQITHELE